MKKRLLTKISAVLFVVFLSSSLLAQTLVGTEWETYADNYRFQADGKVLVADIVYYDKNDKEGQRWGTWRQEGDEVFIDCCAVKIRAVINGDKMTGNMRYGDSTTDNSWSAKKIR